MFELIKTIIYLQKLLFTKYRMEVVEYKGELRVFVYGGIEELTKIAKNAKEKARVTYDAQLGPYQVSVKVDGITFFAFAHPHEIEEFERNNSVLIRVAPDN